MTREQLINEAVAKALGWKKPFDGLYGLSAWHSIHEFIFPEIKKRGLLEKFCSALYRSTNPETEEDLFLEGAGMMLSATPEQISEAFLRATGAWTKEMGAN